jgi:hypothetical protein
MKSAVCDCNNIDIGSYDNQVTLKAPFTDKLICVDKCLENEIKNLWDMGIVTTGCCCGHNKIAPFIGVVDEHIEKMKQLGYKVRPNNIRPNDEDSFYPKSIRY